MTALPPLAPLPVTGSQQQQEDDPLERILRMLGIPGPIPRIVDGEDPMKALFGGGLLGQLADQ